MFSQTCVALCHENNGNVFVSINGASWPAGVSMTSSIDGIAGPLLNPAGTTAYAIAPTASTETYTFCITSTDASPSSPGNVTLTIQFNATYNHAVTIPARINEVLPGTLTTSLDVGPGELFDSLEMALLFRPPNLVLITLKGQIPCPLQCALKSVLVVDRSISITPPEASIRHCTCNSIVIQTNPSPNTVTLCNVHIQQLTLESGCVLHVDNINLESVIGDALVTVFTRDLFDTPTPGGVQLKTGASRYPDLTVVSSIVTVDSSQQKFTLTPAPPVVTAPSLSVMDTVFTNGIEVDATVSVPCTVLLVASHFPLPGLILNIFPTSPAVGITRNAFELMTINIDGGAPTSAGLAATEGKVDAPLGAGTAKDHARLIALANAWSATSIVRYNGVDCLGECRTGLGGPLVPDQLIAQTPAASSIPTSVFAGVRVSIPLAPAPGVIPSLISVRRRGDALQPWIDVVKDGCIYSITCVPIATRPDPLDPANVQWFAGPPWFTTVSTQVLADVAGQDPKICDGGELGGTLCEATSECAESANLQTPVVCTPHDATTIALTTPVPVTCAVPVPPSITPVPCEYVSTGANFTSLVPVSPQFNHQYEVVLLKTLSNPYREFGDVGDTCKSLDGAKRCQLANAGLFPSSVFVLFQVAFGERRFAIADPGTAQETFTFQYAVECINGTLYDVDLQVCLRIVSAAPVFGISQTAVTAAYAGSGFAAVVVAIYAIMECIALSLGEAEAIDSEGDPLLKGKPRRSPRYGYGAVTAGSARW